MHATALRTILGTVTDGGGEPLKGAVVELENPDAHSVVSYLTTADGHYEFKRVNSETDFVLSVTYRGHRSHARSISKFDAHMEKVVNFKVKMY